MKSCGKSSTAPCAWRAPKLCNASGWLSPLPCVDDAACGRIVQAQLVVPQTATRPEIISPDNSKQGDRLCIRRSCKLTGYTAEDVHITEVSTSWLIRERGSCNGRNLVMAGRTATVGKRRTSAGDYCGTDRRTTGFAGRKRRHGSGGGKRREGSDRQHTPALHKGFVILCTMGCRI